MNYAIGIDLGTTYSCVAVWKPSENRAEIISNDLGYRTTPSCVAFTSENERLVGNAAMNQIVSNAENTIFGVKRLIGRRFTDYSVQQDIIHWPFRIMPDVNDSPMIEVTYKNERKRFAPEEISSMILYKLREIAQAYLGTSNGKNSIKDAIITVPAYFNDAQRHATKNAGIIAGLNVLKILNEPTAAAIAYGAAHPDCEEKTVLVYDMGGGTFDVSVLRIHHGDFRVLSIGGDTHLGGEDIDNRLVDFLRKDYELKHNRTFPTDARSIRRLQTNAERAKRELSATFKTHIEIDAIGGVDYQIHLTRAKFEGLIQDLIQLSMTTVAKVLADARLMSNEVDEVLMVGGSSRIPGIQTALQDLFGGLKPCQSINAEEAVAYGAAVMAYQMTHSQLSLPLPAKLNKKVSVGNATQSSTSPIPNFILRDVTPLSLGIEDSQGGMCVVIARNTPYPVVRTRQWMTSHAGQTTVTFPIYEGEQRNTKKNHFLGKFSVTGIPPGLAGAERFSVTFAIDSDGILTVNAVCKSTGKEAGIILTGHGKLGSKEVEKMTKDAGRMRDEEKKIKPGSSYSGWRRFSFMRSVNSDV